MYLLLVENAEVMAKLNAGFTRMDCRAGGLGLGLAI